MSNATKSGRSIDELNELYELPGNLRFEAGEGGMPRAVLTSEGGRGVAYLHGAHVTAFQPKGHEPVIFLGRSARYEEGKAIRGGVPICFPWFGAKPGDSNAPSHGMARTRSWDVAGTSQDDQGVEIAFVTTILAFDVTYTMRVDTSLTLTMDVINVTDRRERFEQALHTYCAVGDIKHVEVRGLQGTTYLDQLEGRARREEVEPAIRFAGETDRVYLATPSRKTIVDPTLNREIVFETKGARSTVIWNPWVEKTERMSDLEQDEWPRMLCVETGNIADDAIELGPGERWRLSTVMMART